MEHTIEFNRYRSVYWTRFQLQDNTVGVTVVIEYDIRNSWLPPKVRCQIFYLFDQGDYPAYSTGEYVWVDSEVQFQLKDYEYEDEPVFVTNPVVKVVVMKEVSHGTKWTSAKILVIEN